MRSFLIGLGLIPIGAVVYNFPGVLGLVVVVGVLWGLSKVPKLKAD